MEWVKLKPTVDSGAWETMINTKHVVGQTIRETRASKQGVKYLTADKGVVRNLGEADVVGKTDDGTPAEFVGQVGDKIHKICSEECLDPSIK